MGKKSKAARKLWLQRNSRVLAKRLKKNPKKIYKRVKNSFDLNENLKEAIDKRFLDGKVGISYLSEELFDNTKEILDELHEIIKYCSVIDKRIIKNLHDVIEEFEEAIGFIEDNQEIAKSATLNLEDLKKIRNNLKDMASYIYNTMNKQKKFGRDIRRGHQHLREKTWKNLHRVFRIIKKRGKKLRKEVKSEKIDEKKIKSYSSDIKKEIKKLSKEDKDKRKKLLKDFNKTISKYIKVLTDEIETIKSEVKKLFEIEKYTTVAYFEMFNLSKNSIGEKVKYLKDNNYVYMDKLKEDYQEIQESIKEHQDFDYYIEKWLRKFAKKELTHDKDLKESAEELDNLEKAA